MKRQVAVPGKVVNLSIKPTAKIKPKLRNGKRVKIDVEETFTPTGSTDTVYRYKIVWLEVRPK